MLKYGDSGEMNVIRYYKFVIYISFKPRINKYYIEIQFELKTFFNILN